MPPPTKRTRLSAAQRNKEKSTLQNLNERLERYVLWLREKEADRLSLQETIKTLEEQIEERDKNHANLVREREKEAYRYQEHAARIQILEQQIDKLINQVADTERLRNLCDDNKRVIEALRKQNQDLDEKNKKLIFDLSQTDSKLNICQNNCRKLEDKVKSQTHELETFYAECKGQKDLIATIKEENKKQRATIEGFEDERPNLVAENEGLKQKVQALETNRDALRKIAESTTPSFVPSRCEEHLVRIRMLEKNLRSLEKKLRQSFGEQLRCIVQEMQADYKERTDKLDQEIADLTSEKHSLKHQVEGLLLKLEDFKDTDNLVKNLTARALDAEEKAKELEKLCDENKTRIQDLYEDLKNRDTAFEEHNKQCGALIGCVTQDRDKALRDLKNARDKEKDLGDKIGKLEGENEGLKEKIRGLKIELSRLPSVVSTTPLPQPMDIEASPRIDNEIKAYELLLTSEEERCGDLGFMSPPPSESKLTIVHPTESSIIVRNENKQTIDLTDWSLETFPSAKIYPLPPGLSLTYDEAIQISFVPSNDQDPLPDGVSRRVSPKNMRDISVSSEGVIILKNAQGQVSSNRGVVGIHRRLNYN